MTPNPPSPGHDEFYVGYEDAVPPRLGARVRQACVTALAVAVAAAGLSLAAHRRLDPSRFDFGQADEVRGTLTHAPYPSVRTSSERLWLVGQGKHGADAAVADVPDGPVTLQGARIQRGSHAMAEVVPGSVRAGDGPGAVTPQAATDDSVVTLTGEVVDSKCFLGVMNPGEAVVHRDCARMCLRGGMPPMLLVRGGMGEEALVLLVSAAGGPLGPALAEIAGVPVAVRGRLRRDGDMLVLAADRDAFRVIDAR